MSDSAKSIFLRTELLFGKKAMETLCRSRVAVFGVGGVGGYTVEALVRSGIGAIDLIDNDKVSLSNINRQIVATTKTVGKYKVDVAKERILDINPEVIVNTYKTFYNLESSNEFNFEQYDYVVDAIDTVSSKILLIEQAKKWNIPIISSMGAGNKIDPTKFEVCDIAKTSVCPLARVIRTELRKRNIENVKVVYSKEPPIKIQLDNNLLDQIPKGKTNIPGSNSFVPPVVGLIIAGEVIKDLIKI